MLAHSTETATSRRLKIQDAASHNIIDSKTASVIRDQGIALRVANENWSNRSSSEYAGIAFPHGDPKCSETTAGTPSTIAVAKVANSGFRSVEKSTATDADSTHASIKHRIRPHIWR